MSQPNNYTGGTTVSGGLLQLGNSSALGASSGSLAVSGGTLDLTGFSPIVGNVTLASGAIVDSSGTATLTANAYAVQNGLISASLAGTGGLTKTTVGQVTLSGSNGYAGTTVVNAGILQFGTSASLYGGNIASWTPGNITVAASATLAVNIGGPTDFTRRRPIPC